MDAIAVDGLRISFARAGQGVAVVLLGGFMGGAEGTWRHQIDALSKDRTVVAWDAPGSGASAGRCAGSRVLPPRRSQVSGLVLAGAYAGWAGSLPSDTAIRMSGHLVQLPTLTPLPAAFARLLACA